MKDINIRWNFSYLAGYALKDGIKFEKAESLDDVCNFLDDTEVFYFKKDMYKKSLIGTDEEAFMIIKNLWNERWNNDGGWGELTANTYDGIVLALKNYDFNFYGEEEPGSIAKLSIQETEERYEAKIAQLKEQLKAKDERIAELEAKLKNMCAECECAKFADNAIKPSEMWKLHLALKDNE